jgi:hypothetical protein
LNPASQSFLATTTEGPSLSNRATDVGFFIYNFANGSRFLSVMVVPKPTTIDEVREFVADPDTM